MDKRRIITYLSWTFWVLHLKICSTSATGGLQWKQCWCLPIRLHITAYEHFWYFTSIGHKLFYKSSLPRFRFMLNAWLCVRYKFSYYYYCAILYTKLAAFHILWNILSNCDFPSMLYGFLGFFLTFCTPKCTCINDSCQLHLLDGIISSLVVITNALLLLCIHSECFSFTYSMISQQSSMISIYFSLSIVTHEFLVESALEKARISCYGMVW